MSAEAELNAVKKVEANKYCVNCDAYNKFGHGNICEKFKTFVCSNCKSAHQSFSMRVKSVSMSNWSKDEVDALRDENGGGNAAAKRAWLGTWDESQMRKPTDKDHVDYFKKFINRVYNDKAFYVDSPSTGGTTRDERTSQHRPSPSLPQAAATTNLLDFAAAPPATTFDAFGATAQATTSTGTTSSSSADGWGAFASAPAPATQSDGFGDFAAFSAAPVAASTQSFDPFGVSASSSTSAPATTTTQSFDPFGMSGASSAAAPAAVQPVSFDPFGAHVLQPQQLQQSNLYTAPPTAPMAPPPSKNFSAFDELAAPNRAFGYAQPQHHGHHGHHGHHHAHHQQQHHHAGGFHHQSQQHHQPQMMHHGNGFGVNPAANISAFMAPGANSNGSYNHHQQQQYRASVASSGGNSRDPFAGLGLPHH